LKQSSSIPKCTANFIFDKLVWPVGPRTLFTPVRLLECKSLETKNLKGFDYCELCFKCVSSLLKRLFQVSNHVETTSIFHLTLLELT
jgi:hypothetical protein